MSELPVSTAIESSPNIISGEEVRKRLQTVFEEKTKQSDVYEQLYRQFENESYLLNEIMKFNISDKTEEQLNYLISPEYRMQTKHKITDELYEFLENVKGADYMLKYHKYRMFSVEEIEKIIKFYAKANKLFIKGMFTEVIIYDEKLCRLTRIDIPTNSEQAKINPILLEKVMKYIKKYHIYI